MTEATSRQVTVLKERLAAVEERLTAVETMLEEIAQLYSEDGYRTFEVDEVVRDGDDRIVTVYGTTVYWESQDYGSYRQHRSHPYIIGEV